ncbi:MAG: hypothetical protein ACI9BD_000060 [Candidatus Marinamargulisbacteria bacterium]|jgi:hypothetical protein
MSINFREKHMARIFALFLILFVQTGLSAADGLHTTSFVGWSESLNSTLKIHREGASDITHQAKWEGRSFRDSIYYAIRFEDWKDNEGWGIEWIHHKIYLSNLTSEIQDFSVSDGYNLLFLTKAWRDAGTIYRLSAGLALSHPDVTLAGRARFWNDGGMGGTYLTGFGVGGGVETWLVESDRHFVSLEGKLTLAYAKVPISKNKSEYGDTGINVGFHVMLGFGSKPIKDPDLTDHLLYWLVPGGAQAISQYIPTRK